MVPAAVRLLQGNGLAGSVLDVVPGLHDDALDAVGHGHVVQFAGLLVAALVGPFKELECGCGLLRLVLHLVHHKLSRMG